MYLDLLDWRRSVARLYAEVRGQVDPRAGHQLWREGRDDLFRHHPESPLPVADPLRETGLPYWPYEPALRFSAPLLPADEPRSLTIATSDGETRLTLAGRVHLPEPIGCNIDAWWLAQYAGGLFLPLRDGGAGTDSYGGGRYLLDTAKGADLGADGGDLVLDLNFLYHPSCRYSPEWSCPLAPAGNRVQYHVAGGERLRHP